MVAIVKLVTLDIVTCFFKCMNPFCFTVDARPQCVRDQDCSKKETCHQGSCILACSRIGCGPNANCMSEFHKGICRCLPGYFGNPDTGCEKGTFTLEKGLWNAWNSFLFHLASISPPPILSGCSSNNDCPDYTACESRKCINPCAKPNVCAPNANCRVTKHEPICTCPDGYVGSPQLSCSRRKSTNTIYQTRLRLNSQFNFDIQF